MLKSLKNFISVVVLIAFAKLIQMTVYIEPDYAKAKKEKPKVEVPAKLPEKANSQNNIDSVAIGKNDKKSQEKVSESGEKEVQKKTTPETSVSTSSAGDYFQNLKNTYLNPILAELPEGRSREDVVVRYYKHNEDRDKVYALRALGYYLHEKEAEDSKESPSNVLYYGSDVDIRDIQIVAYTLLKNGVPLKAIQPSQYDWKYHSLEIGADSLLEGKSTLKIANVQAFNR
ncbi:MAG: hypothetical protein RIM99_06235 [Cyclobacteriaceae bacterium]